MSTETLNYTIPASGPNPAVTVSATLTVDANGVVTGITGTWNGQTINGLYPVGGFAGNDNKVAPGTDPFVTNKGLSFILAGGTGGDDGKGNVNFYSNGPGQYTDDFTTPSGSATSASLTPACYVRGTMLLTDAGERAVETLAIGDVLITATGVREPIRWIGQRSYAGRFLQAQPHLLPILFRADSIADGIPNRDLRVSPAHSMFLGNVLVPASLLVNGSTVIQETAATSVEYYHVELRAHAVIVANGAASESFVDDASRGMFHNVADFAALYPDAESVPAVFCAPVVTEGYALEVIRAELASRAADGNRKAA